LSSFYKRVAAIAVPITLQNIIVMSLNLVDNLVIGQLGAVPIAAVGLITQLMFILMITTFGAAGGASIFVSQYWGKRDLFNIEKTLGHIVKITLAIGALFFVLLFFFPSRVLSVFTTDHQVIEVGSLYARVIAPTAFMSSFSFVIAMALRTVEKAKIPMLMSAGALTVNTVGTVALVFGLGPFPELGVLGAAIATLFSRAFEMALYVFVIARKKTPVRLSLGSIVGFDPAFFKRMMKYALPVITNETFWSIGITMYAIVLARMGTDALATRNIVSTMESLGFVFFGGLASSTVVLVGTELGNNAFTKAEENARRILRLSFFISILAGILIIVMSRVLVNLYNVDVVIKNTAVNVMLVLGIALPLKLFNAITIVGILRSGGDTRAAMLLELLCLWCIGVPLVATTGLVLNWPVLLVYIAMLPEEIIKGLLGRHRMRSKKWLKNVVD